MKACIKRILKMKKLLLTAILLLLSIFWGYHNYKEYTTTSKNKEDACFKVAWRCALHDYSEMSDFNHCVSVYTAMKCDPKYLYALLKINGK